jgi:hypothetical protein
MSENSEKKQKGFELEINALNDILKKTKYIHDGGNMRELKISQEATKEMSPKLIEFFEGLKNNSQEHTKLL